MASSPPPPAAHGEGGATMSLSAVCCMCGDHGLADELFRCRSCRARLQHRYCSDLYPRAAAYRRCNWCLRDPAPAGVGRAGHAAAAAAAADADSSKPEEKRKTTTLSASDEERRRQQRHEGWSPRSRSSPPAELGHLPVKKKHRAEEKTPSQPAEAAALGKKETIVNAGAGGVGSGSKDKAEVMRAGKARVNRVRVRRYKLLTEVISC